MERGLINAQPQPALHAVKATPTARAVTLAPGKYTRKMALVYKATKLSNVGELAAWVL